MAQSSKTGLVNFAGRQIPQKPLQGLSHSCPVSLLNSLFREVARQEILPWDSGSQTRLHFRITGIFCPNHNPEPWNHNLCGWKPGISSFWSSPSGSNVQTSLRMAASRQVSPCGNMINWGISITPDISQGRQATQLGPPGCDRLQAQKGKKFLGAVEKRERDLLLQASSPHNHPAYSHPAPTLLHPSLWP